MHHFRDRLVIGMITVYITFFAIWSALSPSQAVSPGERRPLQDRPPLSLETLSTGMFMRDFEVYLKDQFPLRESFRHLKSRVVLDLFGQTDHHGIFVHDGMAARLTDPPDPAKIRQTAGILNGLMTEQLKASRGRIWFGLIPDKSVYLAADAGVPAPEHDSLMQLLRDELPQSMMLDLKDQLTAAHFYRTDLHWRQESLPELASHLAGQMGFSLPDMYRREPLTAPFSGVYQSQGALGMPPDRIQYLTSPAISSMKVFDHETNRWHGVYDPAAALGPDPYAFFLSGAKPLLTIDNPESPSDRELVVFRDSFGSSLIPLLAQGYARTTVIDIRYIAPSRLDQLVSFHGQDVLFLYSFMVLTEGTFLR